MDQQKPIHKEHVTQIHIHTHTYTHTCIHAYIYACMHTYIYAYIHTYIHTLMCVCICVFARYWYILYTCTIEESFHVFRPPAEWCPSWPAPSAQLQACSVECSLLEMKSEVQSRSMAFADPPSGAACLRKGFDSNCLCKSKHCKIAKLFLMEEDGR